MVNPIYIVETSLYSVMKRSYTVVFLLHDAASVLNAVLFMPRHKKKKKMTRYYAIPSEILSVRQSFIILCPRHNTLRDIYKKLHTNVKHHETMCRTHEP